MGYPVKMSLFPPSDSLRRVSYHWYETADCDQQALALHLRHYPKKSRLERKSPAFIGPGEKIVLLTAAADALFVWRFQQIRDDQQVGVNCSVFRNEGIVRSSQLITEACEVAWDKWPGERLFTFIDPAKVKPTIRRGEQTWGFCYRKAGWNKCGVTPKGLLIFDIQQEGRLTA